MNIENQSTLGPSLLSATDHVDNSQKHTTRAHRHFYILAYHQDLEMCVLIIQKLTICCRFKIMIFDMIVHIYIYIYYLDFTSIMHKNTDIFKYKHYGFWNIWVCQVKYKDEITKTITYLNNSWKYGACSKGGNRKWQISWH